MRQIIFFFLLTNSLYINSQILFTENFDNYNLGIISNDITGRIPGQGDWLTYGYGHNYVTINDFFISTMNNKGQVAVIKCNSKLEGTEAIAERTLTKTNFNNFWSLRDPGNEILKLEYSIYIPRTSKFTTNSFSTLISLKDNCLLNKLDLNVYNNDLKFQNLITNFSLPTGQWIKIIAYLEYNTGVIYHEIPSINFFSRVNRNVSKSQNHYINLIQFSLKGFDHSTFPYEIRIDDIIMSAINSIPKLENTEYISNSLNIFPNPTSDYIYIQKKIDTNIISIDIINNEGKLISTKKIDDQNNIELNIKNLANGSYTLYINTNTGIGIKKIIKK